MRVWVATVVRLVLAAVWAWVAVARIADPAASVDAVRAYQLLPDVLERGIGYGLPFVAFALAALLLLGLAVRVAAAVSAALFLLQLVGLVAAAAPGLRISSAASAPAACCRPGSPPRTRGTSPWSPCCSCWPWGWRGGRRPGSRWTTCAPVGRVRAAGGAGRAAPDRGGAAAAGRAGRGEGGGRAAAGAVRRRACRRAADRGGRRRHRRAGGAHARQPVAAGGQRRQRRPARPVRRPGHDRAVRGPGVRELQDLRGDGQPAAAGVAEFEHGDGEVLRRVLLGRSVADEVLVPGGRGDVLRGRRRAVPRIPRHRLRRPADPGCRHHRRRADRRRPAGRHHRCAAGRVLPVREVEEVRGIRLAASPTRRPGTGSWPRRRCWWTASRCRTCRCPGSPRR